jgi:hypothetical protein
MSSWRMRVMGGLELHDSNTNSCYAYRSNLAVCI